MQTRILGRSGLAVSALGLGCMGMSDFYGQPDDAESIRTLHRALLVMHSPTDNTVGITNASQIFRAARHPRSFVSLEGADHLLTKGDQAKRAGRIISAWADPYLS